MRVYNMMHIPGTFTIWRTITVIKHAPRYAMLYWHYQRRHQRAIPHYKTLNLLLNGTYFVMGLLLPILAFGGICLMFTLWSIPMLIIVISGLALFPGLGAILLASRIAIGAHGVNWDLLLVLPQPRYEIVLRAVRLAYEPGPLLMSLSVVELLGLALNLWEIDGFMWRVPLLAGAIFGEWLQWIALSVSVGIFSGSGQRRQNLALPVVFGVIMIVLRSGGGWLVATLLHFPSAAMVAAMVIGPLAGIAKPTLSGHFTGLLIAMMWLGGLEIVVRSVFAWTLARVGE